MKDSLDEIEDIILKATEGSNDLIWMVKNNDWKQMNPINI